MTMRNLVEVCVRAWGKGPLGFNVLCEHGTQMKECILFIVCSAGLSLEYCVDGVEPVAQEGFKGNLIAGKPERKRAPVASISTLNHIIEECCMLDDLGPRQRENVEG